MAVAESSIEWTDSTWSPVTGCTKVSPGCDHCYAETIAKRFAGTKAFPNGFDVTLHPERLDQPARWRKPRRIFVNSMSDLFHDQVPDEFIARVFAVMALADWHTYQVLTKRHGRMRSLLTSRTFPGLIEKAGIEFIDGHASIPWPLRNVWLGVSVENQQWADIRIPALLGTPAAVRFLSCEPLLGPVDLAKAIEPNFARHGWKDLSRLHWVIVGGESGHGARPMHPDWARSLRDQCQAAGVPFHFKQWGAWAPGSHDRRRAVVAHDDGELVEPAADLWQRPGSRDELNRRRWAFVHRLGKKTAGRELDGRTWDEFPEVVDR